MMRDRVSRVVVVCAVLLLWPGRAQAQVLPAEDHVVELGLMLWTPTPQVMLSSDELSVSDLSEVDLVQEFGIENDTFPEFRGVIGRRHKLRVSHVTISYDADTTINRTFTFRGRTFTVGAPARADFKWDLWKFGYEWDVVSLERVLVGLIADVKYNRVNAAVDSPVLREAASMEVTAPVPTIGVIGRGYIGRMLAVTGELTGLKVTRDEFEAKFVDFDLNAIVSFGRYVGVQGGYRSVVVEYLVDEDAGDLRMKGPYFGGLLRF